MRGRLRRLPRGCQGGGRSIGQRRLTNRTSRPDTQTHRHVDTSLAVAGWSALQVDSEVSLGLPRGDGADEAVSGTVLARSARDADVDGGWSGQVQQ